MPRKWPTHWPVPEGPHGEADRERVIHTLGNLTLLTGKLNSKVSNGPWLGSGGKRAGLQEHGVLLLNRELLKRAGDQWTEDAIRVRTRELAELIIQIWPVPPNYRSGFSPDRPRVRRKLQLADLISGGVLEPGMPLFPRRSKHSDRVVTLLPDGQVEVDGIAHPGPTEAASAITGRRTRGWWFFLVDQTASGRSLRTVRRDYVNAMGVDIEDDEEENAGDDDDG